MRSSTGWPGSARSRTSARRSIPRTPAGSRTAATPPSSAFDIRGDEEDAVDKIDPILDRVADVQKANPGFFIAQFGDTSANEALEASFSKDMKKAGLFSLPLTLAILVVAFGALVAAGIPLLLGITAVLATLGLFALPSQFLPADDSVSAIVLLVGLAVGVDYSLVLPEAGARGTRGREERAGGPRGRCRDLRAARS